MQRRKITVTGMVQGVGFRPFVYKLACRLELGGWVLNNAAGVQIEVEGADYQVAEFLTALTKEAPPLAAVGEVLAIDCPLQGGEREFVIRHSTEEVGKTALISPDVATCLDCQQEIRHCHDRRYGYAFTNCTNCGPRYTIIKDVPYDRATTTMAGFTMCASCQAEYDNPTNRRFHAQPNACPICGPEYRLLGSATGIEPFQQTKALIAQGAIVAIKGIGGYHLACDARNQQAVQRLRSRKIREDKPLAVMAGSLVAIRRICEVSPAEEEMLSGTARPVVLLAKHLGYNLADSVAPGNPYLGVMLPYAPVHWLLLNCDDIWVMTSGNCSDEPIAYEDDDALNRLAEIADYFLVHNRGIDRPADDSVVRLWEDRPYFVRRSRGFVPSPIILSREIPPIFATGGELKNTFCLTRGRQAFVSAHIGDLENLATYYSYIEMIAHYQKLFDIKPEVVAYDLHPEYLATKYALTLDLPKIGVQHHHAHIAAVLAEHGLCEQVIGVAFDGTGYGTDGALWGGEFLVADCRNYRRAGHCRYLHLPGGAKAIKEPWRLATWVLYELFGQELIDQDIPFVRELPATWRLVTESVSKGINAPLSSGAGRLFDVAAALLGLRYKVNYEGQAAIELELAAKLGQGWVLPYDICDSSPYILDFRPTFAAMVAALSQGAGVANLAAAFHSTLAAAVVKMVKLISGDTGLRKVALSGGVWQNITLLDQVVGMLRKEGLAVYSHRQIPSNDGGLSLGQAVVAGEIMRQ
jgi:hydrogenase maturation protein HypF